MRNKIAFASRRGGPEKGEGGENLCVGEERGGFAVDAVI